MRLKDCSSNRWSRPISTILILGGLLLTVSASAWAAKTPAVPVPSNRWGTLQPAGILGDSTSFDGSSEPTLGKVREYHDVDIENGYLFVATGQGMAIYDLRTNPSPTSFVSYIFGWITGGAFPIWNFSDKDWYIKEVDAPAGFDGLVALGMEEQGFAVVNTANKAVPVVAYQGEVDVSKVYAFTSGAAHYAYAVARSGGKVHRFSLSAAAGMTRCTETPPAGTCPGVYLGEVAGLGTGNRDIQGIGGFVVTSRGGATGSARIYSIADPAAPALRLEIPGGTQTAVLWQQGSSFFVARLAQSGQISIHDVSCIAAGSCTGVPPALSTLTSATPQLYLKLSLDGGHPYIYVGNDDLGTCAPQREYLYDLTNPASPLELTPKVHPDGYWGWYYMNCSTGFNLIGPRRGKVYKGVLYRAAYNLLDAHKLQTVPPPVCGAHVDGVTVSPLSPVVCQPVTFTATGVSGKLPYSWTLTGAGSVPVPGVGSGTDVLTWSTTPATPPGAYTATITVNNTCDGVPMSDSKSATVTLSALPALPAAGSFTPTTEPSSGIKTGMPVTFHVNAPGATAWNWDFDGDGAFNEADWTSDPVAGPNPTFTYPTKGIRQVRVKVRNCLNLAGVMSAAVIVDVQGDGGTISVNGPASGLAKQPLQFVGSGSNGCNPDANGWTWTAPGGVVSGQPAGIVSISWTTAGTKTVTATNSACPGKIGSRQVQIAAILEARFTSSPTAPNKGQAVSFNGSTSAGNPTSYSWDFGDHTVLGSGVQVSHTYANSGTYSVTLSVTRAGGECPPAPFCENSASKSIVVAGGGRIVINGPESGSAGDSLQLSGAGVDGCNPGANGWTWTAQDGVISGQPAGQVTISWATTGTKTVTATNSACTGTIGSRQVQIKEAGFKWTVPVEVGQSITFAPANPTSWSWDFGDGATATGQSVAHVFAKAGDFKVTMTVNQGSASTSSSQTVTVVQPPSLPPVVVPWVARSRGTTVQTSDLYVYNPGAAPMTVSLELRRRGLPEVNPPQATRTVAPGATLVAADAVKSLFGRDENLSGFVLVTPAPGSPQPVVTSQQTGGPAGSVFGLAIQGIPLPSSVATGLQLVGMNDSSKRTSYFGVTNPTAAPVTYRLRFFDATGKAIGTPGGDLTLSPFGQKQFQLAEIRSTFGVSNQEDYRIAVESSAGPLFPYGVDVWTSTNDPSLVGNGPSGTGRAWLIGVSNKPGADGSTWTTDAVLSNTTSQPLAVNLTFTGLGVASTPTAPVRVALTPGMTRRLDDVLGAQWNLKDTVGVLRIDSDPIGGALPVTFAETYRSPFMMGKRYGHSMAVMTEADAAGPGKVHSLVGLRQDAANRTTVWVLNAGSEMGEYDVVYRGLDGAEMGRIVVRLAPGKVRQLSPAQHPLPESGVPDGFTIDIVAHSGKVLAAAQGVNTVTNDSTYIRGVTQ